MMNSIDFYKGIFLHVIPVRIIVPCSRGKASSNKPGTIVCKILSYKQKKEVLKNVKKRKGSNIFINEDLL